jgi:AraC-like DNA-binding protein/mannose-6-phosphate isomerase-like protein (cupin superfamily)
MKPGYEHIQSDGQSSLRFFMLEENRFEFYWHYHPEIELTCILKGEGTRLVGDHIGEYGPNDLVLIGPNVPHTWQSKDPGRGPGRSKRNKAIVVQFPQELLTHQFLDLPEMDAVNALFADAEAGIRFTGLSAKRGRQQLIELHSLPDLARLLGLIELLDHLGRTGEWIRLGSAGYSPHLNRKTEKRLDRVLHYLHSAFRKDICLADLASIAAMNETAFSRFFKSQTGKPPIAYLNEVRVRQACQMLVHTVDPVGLIAHHCGYNNQTHFNRQFRRYTRCSPAEYRKLRHGRKAL